jgi:predicted amidophosphoribosyltransferase
MPDPALIRVHRHRLRKAGKLPPVPVCPDCGARVLSTKTAPLCSKCWKRTPAGRAADAERKRRRRQVDT